MNHTTKIQKLTALVREKERKDSPGEERSTSKKSQQHDMNNPIATVIGLRTEHRDQRGSQPSDSQTNNSNKVTRIFTHPSGDEHQYEDSPMECHIILLKL